ncbi:MAG TPA: hybrid sensor histidine kinase/response regulator, partial [Burkholderiaceae bacterium]|nr:hybrid sensor histidine kinase/response regulator [Burkholderiaceae bacterium]
MLTVSNLSHPTDGAENDLGPLAWVFDELRKSLDGAHKALKRFAADVADARGSDLSAIDPTPLRLARSQLHQVVGALEMVDFHAPASVVRAMETAVQRFLNRPLTCTEAAVGKLERAGFALVEYLESVLHGKPISPVALFPQYRDVQELAAAARIHPADLWRNPVGGLSLTVPAEWQVQPLAPGVDVRARFDRYVLHVVKNLHPIAAGHLRSAALGLAAGASGRTQTTFWVVAAAYFEAIQHGLLPADVYVKRAASRVLLQYSAQAQGKLEVSHVLLQDLLFFVARAKDAPKAETPVLDLVRAALGSTALPPIDYESSTLGRFDPALLAQARRRVLSAKEGWSLLAGGDTDKLRQVGDQFTLVADSLHKVLPDAAGLAQGLVHAIDQVRQSGGTPGAELGMEVATALLFLEALLQDLEVDDPQLPSRLVQMGQRVEQACAGQSSPPLEQWMEDLYRKVSDRQTMGSVVGELKVSLTELERELDQFVREPGDKAPLMRVPQRLHQMRGVLSVLGLDHAVSAVMHMRTTVEDMLADEVDAEQARQAGTFSRLANNLSALSFLIDMLHYQPALARKLFVFDPVSGELNPVMGRVAAAPAALAPTPEQPSTSEETAAQPQALPHDEVLDSQVTMPGDSLQSHVGDMLQAVSDPSIPVDLSALSLQLDSLADQAALSDHAPLAAAARQAASAVASDA